MYEYRLGTTVFTDGLPRSSVKGYTDVIVCRNGTACVSVVDKIHCFPRPQLSCIRSARRPLTCPAFLYQS